MIELEAWIDKIRFLSESMESTAQPFGCMYPDGHLLLCNNALCELLGYSKKELEEKVNWSDDLTPEKYRDYEASKLEEISRAGKPQKYVKEYIRKDGARVPVELLVHPAIDSHGKVLFYYSFITDITGYKQVEESLLESEEKFRVLAETAPVAICIMQDGRFQYVNNATEKITGYDRGHLLSTDFLDLIHPDFQGAVVKLYTDWLDGRIRGLYRFEIKILPDGGAERWVDVSVNTVEYRGRPGLIMTASDITGRKRADEALNKNLAVLAKSQEIGRLASWSYDCASKKFQISDEMYHIYGFAPGTVEPTKDLLYKLIHPDDLERYREWFESLVLEGRLGGIDYQVVWPDGSAHYLHAITDSNVRGPDGRVKTMSGITQDITERKRAEDALRESEEKFRALFEGAGVAIFVADVATGRIIDCNKMAEGLTGRSRDEIIGLHQTQVHPADKEGVQREQFARHAKGIVLKNDEAEVLHRDGRIIPVIVNAAPLKVNGRDILIGFFIDITGRKRAEEALRDSEEMLRHIIDASPIPMVLYNEGENYYFYNKKFHETFGYTIKDVPTIYEWWRLAYPDDEYREFIKKRWYAAVDEAIRNKSSIAPQDAEVTCKDGSKRHILGEFSSIGSMNLSILYDITERKRAEEALRDSKARLEAVFSSMNDAFIIFDTDGKATRANHAAVKFHRFSSMDELLTSLNGYVKLLDTRNTDGTRLTPDNWPINRALRGEMVFNQDIVITRRDTGESWVGNSSAAPIRDEGGNVVAAVITMRDVTEQKRAEEALREAKMQAELYLDLMGHDINNMHQIVLGYLEIAEGMISRDDGRREYIEKPIEVLQRSARLIKNVRKLQKLREGVFQYHEVDVCQLLADVQREFGSVPHKAITVNLDGCERCHVRANELLHDVFANLVSNAIKHTGDRADIEINLGIVNDNGSRYCRVCVEDNGPGIPDDFKARIFNRMLKGTNKSKGMGLGLYLVKSLMESYGGRVWVEDRVKGDHTKGARFVVMLPAIEN